MASAGRSAIIEVGGAGAATRARAQTTVQRGHIAGGLDCCSGALELGLDLGVPEFLRVAQVGRVEQGLDAVGPPILRVREQPRSQRPRVQLRRPLLGERARMAAPPWRNLGFILTKPTEASAMIIVNFINPLQKTKGLSGSI